MDPLPTGTVTMLFSDIEGSTALLSRLGDRYGEALSAQRGIIRAAIAAFGGHEMGTEGDSFFVVFEAALDAVRTAVTAQQALGSHSWPNGAAVRVRMGLHTGEPVRHEEGYVGMDLNRAARIAATGHGGQIVISDATRQLVAFALPADHSLVDLGSHRLKDIDTPQRIFQVLAPGLARTFPPLKSLGAQTSLPVAATPLVGREQELLELREGLRQPGIRLITLTGPGGVGKTRLALALAGSLDRDYPSGVFFVPLASVTNADVMWKVIAHSIDADADRDAAAAVEDNLAGRQALLVLDNLEQLYDAAEVIAALLAAAPDVTVIGTSRRPIHLQGEFEYAVPPLGFPDSADLDAIAGSAAVVLFAQQAALVRRGFTVTPGNAADIAAICRRLDGLPLAIEIAAGRSKLLPPKALLARLGDSLDLAATDLDRPSRQQTLRATIAWSYDLLDPELEQVFCRLGVFRGGCDLDAVAAVACPPGLDPLQAVSDLLDASLVTVGEMADSEPRVGMLETIREFAVDRLVKSGGDDEAGRRHAEYYADFAEQANAQLRGPLQLTWLDRLEIEHDNLRAALAWSLADPSGPDEAGPRVRLGLRLVNALSWFWYGHSHAADGARWLELAIERASGEEGPQLARAVHGFGVLLLHQGETNRGCAALQQNIAVWRQLGDRVGLAKGLNSLGVGHRTQGRLDLARAELGESIELAREEGDPSRLSTALTNLAIVELDSGQPEPAMVLLHEAIELDRKLGDAWAVAVGQGNLAAALVWSGDAPAAHRLLASIADDVVGHGDLELTASTLEIVAIAVAELGADERAARLAGAAERIRTDAGTPIAAPDQALLDRGLAGPRERMGAEAWEAGYAAGRQLTADQAMEVTRLPVS
ncbi:MAG: tetratricopeptide repeat protein [Actinomycetota bacterium]|nr:tetratricopeptide repeat protein [Actinomycetota bacterium]